MSKIISNYGFWILPLLAIGAGISIIGGCTHEDTLNPNQPGPPTLEPLNKQVRVQVAYDATDVAFKFVWKSQQKIHPAGQANVGKNYPMQFHDVLRHDGTKFARLKAGTRMDEDRISVIFDKKESPIAGFGTMGCAVSCHSGMASHNLLSDNILDHWHWRGGRSGPMGYAEDAAINNVERIRDDLGAMPTKFIRSGGDRLREDQDGILSGTGHPVLSDGFPRFVFNKGKTMPGGFVVPGFFLPNNSNTTMIDPYIDIPQIKKLTNNVSLLVVYQDKSFDPIDKVNSLDLGYLVWVATGSTTHLPAHLRDETSADFTFWKSFWAAESKTTTASAAAAKLDQVYAEWIASNKNAMVTRSVAFIYDSDQHDVYTERFFDEARNEWTVILKRKLASKSPKDTDLTTLPSGGRFTVSFAMHDSGSGAITHDISIPYELSNRDDQNTELKAKQVSSIGSVDWNTVPALDTYWVKQALMPKYNNEWLRSGAHPGSGSIESTKCSTCHTETSRVIFTDGVLK